MWSKKYVTFTKWYLSLPKKHTPYAQRIIKYHSEHPGSTLNEARGHSGLGKGQAAKPFSFSLSKSPHKKIAAPPESYRYVLGTNISDQQVPLSFTGFYYNDDRFEFSEEKKCYDLFRKFITKVVQRRYPKKNYTVEDVLGEWGGHIREEHDVRVNHVKNGYYEHELNQDSEEEGDWRLAE